MKRFCAILLTITLLCASLPVVAEDGATPGDLPEEVPAVTETPAEPKPTQEPAEEEPEATEPVEELPPEETAAPTETPADEPTDEPTGTPAEDEAKEEPAEAPAWDEATCDHANPNCVDAPACDTPDCPHIQLDANGLDVPVCALGLWLLERQDALERTGDATHTANDSALPAVRLTSRRLTIDLDRANATIWRSGVYTVTGGAERPAGDPAVLTIAANRIVILQLEYTTLGQVKIGAHSRVTLRLTGHNPMDTLEIGEHAAVLIDGAGETTIQHIQVAEGAAVTIVGGSVKADVRESEGRQAFAFPAAELTATVVDGKPYDAELADADGIAWLWLNPAAEGMAWVGACENGVLTVRQEAALPEEPVAPVAETIVAEAGQVYELTADAPVPALRIDVPDVTVTTALTEIDPALVEAALPYRLVLKAEAAITGQQPLSQVEITAEQPLTIHTAIDDTVSLRYGRVTLLTVPEWLVPVAVDGLENVTYAVVNGETQALSLTEAGEALLPRLAEAENRRWVARVEGDALIADAVTKAANLQLTDSENKLNAADAARFTVWGGGHYVTGSLSAEGAAEAEARLVDVQLQGEDAVLRLADEHLTINAVGDSGLVSTGEAISLTGDSALTLRVTEGRLLLRNQRDLTGITLYGNIKVEPAPEAQHPVLTIRDQNGNPVPNRPMTVQIGEERYALTTQFDGTIELWGFDLSATQAVAVSDDTHVYTAVLVDGEGDAVPGLTIDHVTFEDLADGSLRVTWQANGAVSEGVQYISAMQNRDIPDTYFTQARQATGANHIATLTDITPGEIVSLRVYAASAEAELNADTADGFQFSGIERHTHTGAFKPEKALDATYTGKPYVCPIQLPKEAKVTYRGEKLNADGQPVEPGKYILRLTIPEGSAMWQAGTFEFPFEIKKARLVIHPDPNQEKYEGDDEPELTWTVTGLLPGDELKGLLSREEGEEAGNYAFLVEDFEAKPYYEIVLEDDAPVFTILPFVPGFDPGWIGEVLIPITQEITRKDGRRLALQLKTSDELMVGTAFYGWALLDTESEISQLFSPSLSWNDENDTVLLRLRCLPEMNEDKGYDTNPDGSLRWGGRELRLSWRTLRAMQQQGIDAITLNNNGAQLTLPLGELITGDVADWIRQETYDMNGAEFRLRIEPVRDESSAVQARMPLTEGWNMRATLRMNGVEYDVATLLKELKEQHPQENRQTVTAAVDMEPVAQLLESVRLYDEDTFTESFTLINANGDDEPGTFVTPFLPEETAQAVYARIVYTHRYLLTELGGDTSLWCVWAENE